MGVPPYPLCVGIVLAPIEPMSRGRASRDQVARHLAKALHPRIDLGRAKPKGKDSSGLLPEQPEHLLRHSDRRADRLAAAA